MGRPKRKRLRTFLFFILFVVAFLLINLFVCPSSLTDMKAGRESAATGTLGALSVIDSMTRMADTARLKDSLTRAIRRGRHRAVDRAADSTALRDSNPDTIVSDSSLTTSRSPGGPESDSPPDRTPPTVIADPGPGLHESPIIIKLTADEPALIEYTLNGDTNWRPYSAPLPVSDSADLVFRATDSAGNRSAEVTRAYWIEAGRNRHCPEGMVYITGKKTASFCIDRFEWPNRKGEQPLGFINWYMASDSCRLYKKKLCTGGEWKTACAGRLNRAYPYGNSYEERTCRTEDQNSAASGSYGECRSFYGAYDMSGNLREWTASRAPRNASHFDVYGGFWDSKVASTCGSSQFSFYPENKFISVGFRCCAEPKKE